MTDRAETPPPGPPPPDLPEGAPPPDVPEGPPPRPPWHREWWILLALLVLAAAGLVAWLVLRDDGGGAEATVPAVVGMQQQQAEDRVRAAGLEPNADPQPSDRPEGTVVSQDPAAGTQVDDGDQVMIGVALGGGTTTVTETATVTGETTTGTGTTGTSTQTTPAAMPDVRGQPYQSAVQALTGVGLLVNSYAVQSEELQGTVVSQHPAPRAQVDPENAVRINVAIGSGARGTTEVPDVTGPEVADALEMCAEAEVTCLIEESSAPQPENVGEVVDQDPAAGTTVPTLDQVTLFVGR